MSEKLSGELKIKIYGGLTPDMKGSILMNAGVPPGKAAQVSQHGGPADFWATLGHRVHIEDPNVWKGYPMIQKMVEQNMMTSVMNQSMTKGYLNVAEFAEYVSTNYANNADTNYATNADTTINYAPSSAKESLIAQIYKNVASKKETTIRDFFTAKDGVNWTHAQKLILALDETELWEMILHDEGLTTNPEIATEIQQRHLQWKENSESPTKKLIKDLIDTEWGSKTMSEFNQYLLSKNETTITAIVESWISLVDGKMAKATEIGAKKFVSAKNLTAFFIKLIDEDDVFNQTNIQQFVNKLQDDGITTTALMQELDGNDFKEYGMNKGQIIKLRNALKNTN